MRHPAAKACRFREIGRRCPVFRLTPTTRAGKPRLQQSITSISINAIEILKFLIQANPLRNRGGFDNQQVHVIFLR
jgi:hypothetical protein